MLTGPRRSNQELRLGYSAHLGEVSFPLQENNRTKAPHMLSVPGSSLMEVQRFDLLELPKTEKTPKGSSYQGTKIEGWGGEPISK